MNRTWTWAGAMLVVVGCGSKGLVLGEDGTPDSSGSGSGASSDGNQESEGAVGVGGGEFSSGSVSGGVDSGPSEETASSGVGGSEAFGSSATSDGVGGSANATGGAPTDVDSASSVGGGANATGGAPADADSASSVGGSANATGGAPADVDSASSVGGTNAGTGGGPAAACDIAAADDCACASDSDCAAGERCYYADCARGEPGVCQLPPDEGCFSAADCTSEQVCVGAFVPSCGSDAPLVPGVCTIDPCPVGPACGDDMSGDGCYCFDGTECLPASSDVAVGRCRDLEGRCFACQ